MSSRPGNPQFEPAGCAGVRELVRAAVVSGSAGELPPAAEAHAEGCPDCQREIQDICRVDALIGDAFRSARDRIPGPSMERIDSILAGAGERPPEALLLGRIRRSVNRMLWLTLLALSLLPLCALLVWLLALLAKTRTH